MDSQTLEILDKDDNVVSIMNGVTLNLADLTFTISTVKGDSGTVPFKIRYRE